MKTASLVKEHLERASSSAVKFGLAALYKLSDPYAYDDEKGPCSFMFVSTSRVLGDWETYAFPADETGDCISWSELLGSEKGETTHAKVLANMGYELAASEQTSNPQETK